MLKKLIKSFLDYRRYLHHSTKSDIIFFSEGNQHWTHLKFLVMSLLKEYKVSYISLNLNDLGLKLKHKNYNSFFFGNLFILNLFFQNNNSKYLITSLPDLGKLYFKKYNNNCKFIYIFHSLASSHTQYLRDSFDNFDIILCSGPHHFNEIRKSEEIYNNKKKILYKYGYPRLEEINKSKNNMKINNNKKYILIAPSWGENSITNICLDEIVENLILNNYTVIFRPHNMSLIKDKKKIKNLLKKYFNNKAFIFDNSNSSLDSLFKADLMVTDWGSTGSDFSLGLDKPVIYVDTPPKIRNKEYKQVFQTAFEFEIRKHIGTIINLNDLSNLSTLIDEILKNQNKNDFLEKKTNFLNNYVYNYLSSENEGLKIMKQIIN